MKRFAAWLIFLTFVGISAVANYLHGADALAGFLMAMAPVGFAATMGLLEVVVVRVSWPSRLAMAVVALGSGVASYVSLLGLATDHHVPWLVAVLLPLAFDGVVLASSLAIRSLANGQPLAGLDTDLANMSNPGQPLAKDLATENEPVQAMANEEDTVAKAMATLDTDLASLDKDLDMDTKAWTWAMKAKASGQNAKDIAEELAKRRGVSERTIRRAAWWTQAMKGVEPA